MYLLKWKEKLNGKTVFLSELKSNHLRWDCARKAKTFSSPKELVKQFNKCMAIYNEELYSKDSFWGRRTEIVYIHPLNIPNENEQWID